MAIGGAKRFREEAIRAWRELTGGAEVRDLARPTLVAVSGGADSSALLISLAEVAGARIVAATIGHGLRPAEEDLADIESVRALSAELGVRCIARPISVDRLTNLEASARLGRYDALVDLAQETGCRYIATGHHGGDQLETMLMNLTRGSALCGLAGMSPSRPLGQGVALIRPMLGLTRDACEQICGAFGYRSRHDATNDDLTRRRAWLRDVVMPMVRSSPGLPARLASASALLLEAQGLVAARAEVLMCSAEHSAGMVMMPLGRLSGETGLVVGEVLRALADSIEPDGGDHRGWKHLEPIVAAIRSGDGVQRRFDLFRVRVVVEKEGVTLRRLAAGDQT